MTQQIQFAKAVGNANEINELLRRYGVKFGIYKNGVFNEQFFPFDPIPRVISAEDFQSMEKGLVQRVNALNEFLFDIYHEKRIVRDGIIPEDFIYISSGYLAECEGVTPKNEVYSHISGIDLVQAKDGEWYILEDNLRIPSGASYPLIARELTRIAAPKANGNAPQHHSTLQSVKLTAKKKKPSETLTERFREFAVIRSNRVCVCYGTLHNSDNDLCGTENGCANRLWAILILLST